MVTSLFTLKIDFKENAKINMNSSVNLLPWFLMQFCVLLIFKKYCSCNISINQDFPRAVF